jgi:hypothetical protein
MPPKSSDKLSVRSDIVLQGKEGNGAFGGKGKSIFDVERNGQVRTVAFVDFCIFALYSHNTRNSRDALFHARTPGEVPETIEAGETLLGEFGCR